MAINDIYNDNSLISHTDSSMTHQQASDFMREVNKHPTDPSKQWVVRNKITGSRIYFVR